MTFGVDGESATPAVSALGLLIVNADDWGGFRDGTDAIEACFQAGAISSSTAMVHMADSRRAAEMALERKRPIGLHLNLTQPFDAPDVPTSVHERQGRLCRHFTRLGIRRWVLSPDPRVHSLIADAIRDQLQQFADLYGSEPTHVDSHHHVHVCPDVFLSRALPRGLCVRQTLSPPPGAGQSSKTFLREAKHGMLARRFIAPSMRSCACSSARSGSKCSPARRWGLIGVSRSRPTVERRASASHADGRVSGEGTCTHNANSG